MEDLRSINSPDTTYPTKLHSGQPPYTQRSISLDQLQMSKPAFANKLTLTLGCEALSAIRKALLQSGFVEQIKVNFWPIPRLVVG